APLQSQRSCEFDSRLPARAIAKTKTRTVRSRWKKFWDGAELSYFVFQRCGLSSRYSARFSSRTNLSGANRLWVRAGAAGRPTRLENASRRKASRRKEEQYDGKTQRMEAPVPGWNSRVNACKYP